MPIPTTAPSERTWKDTDPFDIPVPVPRILQPRGDRKKRD
jgi:hypothetical protein